MQWSGSAPQPSVDSQARKVVLACCICMAMARQIYTIALEWVRKAAAKSHADSQYQLGCMNIKVLVAEALECKTTPCSGAHRHDVLWRTRDATRPWGLRWLRKAADNDRELAAKKNEMKYSNVIFFTRTVWFVIFHTLPLLLPWVVLATFYIHLLTDLCYWCYGTLHGNYYCLSFVHPENGRQHKRKLGSRAFKHNK